MHKTFVALAAVLAAVLLSVAPMQAQSPPADTAAAAKELIVAMRTADQFRAILPAIMQKLKPAIVQNRKQMEGDYDAIMPILMNGMSARVDEIIDQIAAVYAAQFTVDELRDLTAFYRSPAGQKLLQRQPVIVQESMVIGQNFGQKVATEMQSQIVEELRKRGHKL